MVPNGPALRSRTQVAASAHVTRARSHCGGRLVWCPPTFASFVLVDDDGTHLATGCPTGQLPNARARAENYMLVRGSKYATEAERIGSQN